MVRIRQILVPTDFSATSDAALDYAREVATRFGATLRLLHVVHDPFANGPLASDAFVTDTPGVRTTILDEFKTRLADRLTDRDREALGATAEVVFGQAAETIVDYAAGGRIDLIVMGTHGRTGMAHLLLGSVAERVVRTAHCPVLTVRALAHDADPVRVIATAPIRVPS
jgi:nucleotide-binding universal stress UspA family protein